MTNLEIAELLRDIAASYQLKGDKYKFQTVAYERAADAVEHATSELKDLWDEGKLEEVPGIGPGIASHLDELFKTGKSKHFEDLKKDIPKEAFKLMKLPGIGIKTALKLISDGDQKLINEKLREVEVLEKKGTRHLLPYADLIASEVIDYMKKNPKVQRIEPLGSLRRRVSTVGDIDIAVVTKDPDEVLNYFTKYPKAQSIIEKGTHSSSIKVAGGVQVDLMVQPKESFGSLLQHFTGSKHHNIALRDYALKKGLSLSEYGIKELKGKSSAIKSFENEEDFYRYLGLGYIEPELREEAGEIEAARDHKLPKLVNLSNIKSDLQIHSSFDIETSHDIGANDMQEIVEKANGLGYEYLAFTEHNPSKSMHNDKEIINLLKKKREEVDKINYSLMKSVKGSIKYVFNSLEIDLDKDGNLPVPKEGLETLDFALVSIHSSFDLPRDIMTKRVLNGLSNKKVKIFAHPTARKLNEREGVELDWRQIFDFCVKNNKWIEINADPMRLDLPDNLVHEAVNAGVKLTLGTDSHDVGMMENMIWGVSVARRGWAKASDIINTRSLTEFKKLLKEGD